VLEDEKDLYREMGSHGPLYGSLFWKLQQLWRNGVIYDWRDFHQHMFWFTQGMTFKEAYLKTGRILNICCTPLRSRGARAPPLMLNYLDTPNVDIASAVCASSCLPGLTHPVELLEKKEDGTLRPYHDADDCNDRISMRDGSFERDVPLQQLASLFGVTFTIVSQVNPHVLPFWAHVRGRPGRPSGGRRKAGGWRGGFLLGAMEISIKEDLRRHLMTLQRLELLVNLFGVDWSQIWLQPQEGSVTLTPSDVYISDYLHTFENLRSPEILSRFIREMERAVWEADANIQTRMRVEVALANACKECGLSPFTNAINPPTSATPTATTCVIS